MIRRTAFTPAAPDCLDPKTPWQEYGLCRSPQHAGHPDLWFAHDRDRDAVAAARRICQDCPVRDACEEDALDRREQWGIWGGLTERERRSILRQRPKQALANAAQDDEPAPARTGRKPAECGTRSAYQRHVKNKEPIDDACRRANTAADNRLRRTGSTKVAA